MEFDLFNKERQVNCHLTLTKRYIFVLSFVHFFFKLKPLVNLFYNNKKYKREKKRKRMKERKTERDREIERQRDRKTEEQKDRKNSVTSKICWIIFKHKETKK
jgi:hypothetical protein